MEPAGGIQDHLRQRSYITHELREEVGYISVFLPRAPSYGKVEKDIEDRRVGFPMYDRRIDSVQ